MIIAELDVVGIAVHESKADSPLIIHANRMLSFPIAVERVKPIAGWDIQIVQPCGQIDIFKLASRSPGQLRRKSLCLASDVQLLRALVRERLDHLINCNSSRDNCQIAMAGAIAHQ